MDPVWMSWKVGSGTLEVVILLYGWGIYDILQYTVYGTMNDPRRGKGEKEEGVWYACIWFI